MSRFCLIAAHYMKRALYDIKEIILLLIIPIGVITFSSITVVGNEMAMHNGYNVFASFAAPSMVLSFQFFNSFFMFIFLYADFRGERRWRLLAAPCNVRDFVFPAFLASWLISICIGVVVIVVCSLFLNVYWGSAAVLAAVLALISLIATFTAVLIFLFTKKLAQANAVAYVLSFGLMTLSGFMLPLQVFGDNAFVRFLTTYGTPLSIGNAAIISSGELGGYFEGTGIWGPGVGAGALSPHVGIGILAAFTLAIGVFTVIAARGRKGGFGL